jgi:hypothetical protein
MEIQPYKLTIVNKTEEELNSIPKKLLQQHFGFLSTIFAPSYSIDALTDIVFATKEDFEAIIRSLANIGVQGKYSIKKGKDFIFENQGKIIEDGTPEFICLTTRYVCDQCTQDEVYEKIKKGGKLTLADQYVLETAN